MILCLICSRGTSHAANAWMCHFVFACFAVTRGLTRFVFSRHVGAVPACCPGPLSQRWGECRGFTPLRLTWVCRYHRRAVWETSQIVHGSFFFDLIAMPFLCVVAGGLQIRHVLLVIMLVHNCKWRVRGFPANALLLHWRLVHLVHSRC